MSSEQKQEKATVESIDSKKPAKGIFVLPNLFTSAGLFAGFYAIMQARIGNYEAACLAIYGAMIMDIIDGRLARLTNTMSDFGSEYDSLSDMVSFGVAPALVLYDFALSELGRFGSLVAFVYIACAALRLARFNVASGSDKRFFTGVPSPGAAAMIATVIWVCVDYSIMPEDVNVGLALLMVLMALAMVSNIKYRSFKDVDFRDQMPFIGLIVLVLVIAMIYMDPPLAFLMIGSIYMISGAVFYASKKIKARQPKQ
jgi:CDP-diacylglycerol--serine O-phosphatidyltransferase